MKTMLPIGCVLGLLVLGACSGGDDDPNGTGGGAGSGGSSGGASGSGGAAGAVGNDAGLDAGPTTPWDMYCAAAKQQYASCGTSWSGCASSACVATVWNAAALGDYTTCMLARSCAELGSDDDCFSNTGLVNGELPQANQDKLDACIAKVKDCKSQGVSFQSDDFCQFAAPLVDPALSDKAFACINGPCADIDTCLAPLRQQFDCLDDTSP